MPHPDRSEHVVGGPQALARVQPPALTAQPLAVQQAGAGQIGAELGAAKPVDRFSVQTLGGLVFAQQRPAAGLDAEGEIVAAGLRRLRQPLKRGGRHVGVPRPGGRLYRVVATSLAATARTIALTEA
jgi:hypothetical protein